MTLLLKKDKKCQGTFKLAEGISGSLLQKRNQFLWISRNKTIFSNSGSDLILNSTQLPLKVVLIYYD